MAILFPEDIFSHLYQNFMHPFNEEFSRNPNICICNPHYRPFAFHYIISLKRLRTVISQNQIHFEITISVPTYQKSQP